MSPASLCIATTMAKYHHAIISDHEVIIKMHKKIQLRWFLSNCKHQLLRPFAQLKMMAALQRNPGHEGQRTLISGRTVGMNICQSRTPCYICEQFVHPQFDNGYLALETMRPFLLRKKTNEVLHRKKCPSTVIQVCTHP